MKRVWFWGMVMPAVLRRLVPGWFLESPIVVASRHPWRTLALLGAAAAMGGFAFAASGVMPTRASTGHWAVTHWFLEFTMRRSVVTHAGSIPEPVTRDRGLVMLGAGAYDLGCRPCHGAVGADQPRVAQSMLPKPPVLTRAAHEWRPRELFYIVKHGVKFTGMPAWPAQQRDDEVWAVVAFLREMPGLGSRKYLELSRGEAGEAFEFEPGMEPPQPVRDSCARCHGLDGNGRGVGTFPKIAGQRPEYLRRAMRAYAEGRRHSGVMGPVAAGLTPEMRERVVQYYASRTPAGSALGRDAAAAARGRQLAHDGRPGRMIPACAECHGPAATPRHAAYPELRGQHAFYLVQQLELLQQRRRGGSEYVALMHNFVERLEPADIRDAAAYYSMLQPETRAEHAADPAPLNMATARR